MDATDAGEGAVPGERCGAHPERAAASTCERCGTFICAACRSEEMPAFCVDCAARIDRGRLVGHVPILGIVMMVNGVLIASMGLYLAVFGVTFAHSLATAPGSSAPAEDLVTGIVMGGLGFVGLAHGIAGGLQIWAGWRARTFHSRGLALTALFGGLLTVVGCYCTVTAVPILIWGLVVLLDEDVRGRFAATRSSDR
jgi:hypothetical protein